MLFLKRDQVEFMHKHVESCLPEEGCGLIGGNDNHAELILPVTNADHSPVRFYMDERELVSAYIAFEQANLDLVAIFHSHPGGPPEPSETDVHSFRYHPGVLSVILVKERGAWQTRAFELIEESFKEVKITTG